MNSRLNLLGVDFAHREGRGYRVAVCDKNLVTHRGGGECRGILCDYDSFGGDGTAPLGWFGFALGWILRLVSKFGFGLNWVCSCFVLCPFGMAWVCFGLDFETCLKIWFWFELGLLMCCPLPLWDGLGLRWVGF